MKYPDLPLLTNNATSSVFCQNNPTSRLPYLYLRLLRVLEKKLEKNDQGTASSVGIHMWRQWYTLHTGLLTCLIRRSYQFFRIGSCIVNQPNYPLGNLSVLSNSPSAQQHPVICRNDSKLTIVPSGHSKTFSHRLESVLEPTVPEWTPSQFSNKFIHGNTTALRKLSESQVSISHRFLATNRITKSQYDREVSGKYRRSHRKKGSGEPSINFKSTKLQTRASNLFNQELATPILRFLYDRQVTPVIPTVTLKFPVRSWKLCLPQLNYIDALSTQREKVTYSTDTHPFFDEDGLGTINDPVSFSNPNRPRLGPPVQSDVALTPRFLPTHKISSFKDTYHIKAPAIIYHYTMEIDTSVKTLPSINYQPIFNTVYCLLDAATRAWLYTMQANPYGKILIMIPN